MSRSELKAAGIYDPDLQKSYELCKKLNRQHGKTYYLATLLLPPAKRPYVHALYGFARYADEIVDNLASTLSPEEKATWLDEWSAQFFRELETGQSSDPITRATIDTINRWNIPIEHFHAFIHSMKMDLTITRYNTYEDLYEYVYGSAAVIGLQMVPILEPRDQRAYDYAQQLGIAFQLANFIRDVGEDLERGRVYLPMEELKHFGVTEEMLANRKVTPEIKAALAFQIARV
ncbi:MAG: phytoene/squalene synthase family protein, partial [Candidatus Nanopelagicales bacterium]